jgi:hypothetical protein
MSDEQHIELARELAAKARALLIEDKRRQEAEQASRDDEGGDDGDEGDVRATGNNVARLLRESGALSGMGALDDGRAAYRVGAESGRAGASITA